MNAAPPELTFRIHGMHCAEEVALLTRELVPLVGNEDRLGFDVLNGKLLVRSENDVSVEAVIQAVARTGLRAEAWREETRASGNDSLWQQHGRSILTGVGGHIHRRSQRRQRTCTGWWLVASSRRDSPA